MDWMTPLLALLTTGVLILLASRFGARTVAVTPKRPPPPTGLLHCSFCGKSQREVRKLIAGPTVYICEECIGLCNDIIAEEIDRDTKRDEGSLGPEPTPPPPKMPDRGRLRQIAHDLSGAADTLRRIWIIEESESATIIHAMADRIASLAKALRAEASP